MHPSTIHKESLLRYAAFTTDAAGGNPAGVWIGDHLPTPEEMQAIAKWVGYSETAFIAPAAGSHRKMRYYSPEMEVSFCGHATIASGVALARKEGPQTFVFSTTVGDVSVATEMQNEHYLASLTSVEPKTRAASKETVDRYLKILGWSRAELDPTIAPVFAYAGAWHLVLAARDMSRLNRLDYEFDRLRDEMQREELTTLQLIFRESDALVHSRNPFPVGGVVEDPATGAAAAALGGYLREARLLTVPCEVSIHQGDAMGRPSRLKLTIPASGGIIVSGTAVPITA